MISVSVPEGITKEYIIKVPEGITKELLTELLGYKGIPSDIRPVPAELECADMRCVHCPPDWKDACDWANGGAGCTVPCRTQSRRLHR
jgi:hypothetical protein